MKVIPGADREIIKTAAVYADRLSVNIEMPSEKSLREMAPQKRRDHIFGPMVYLSELYGFTRTELRKNKKCSYKNFRYPIPYGHTTQMVMGLTEESDKTILTLSDALYKKFSIKRVYYSAYTPVNIGPKLPNPEDSKISILKIREHRLYQADFLTKEYGFSVDELFYAGEFLDITIDPKLNWALRHMDVFPVDIASSLSD